LLFVLRRDGPAVGGEWGAEVFAVFVLAFGGGGGGEAEVAAAGIDEYGVGFGTIGEADIVITLGDAGVDLHDGVWSTGGGGGAFEADEAA
jgi:hypothetical protein